MRQAIGHIFVETRGKGLTEITGTVARWVDGQGIATGLLTLFCRLTSASLLIQENADPDVRVDLEAGSLSIPVEGGRMALGTWQGLYLFEHRRAPHRRDILLHFIGE